MRSSIFVLLIWASLLALVATFTAQDHEIFRLRDEIDATEGSEVTFYNFLGVKSSASQDEISKAYRKKSRIIHPDKAKQSFIAARATQSNTPLFGSNKPGVHVNKAPSEAEIQKAVKRAGDRYARLGVIAEVLKGSGRERYDFFLTNGFPVWRGTGYYYARFRPGLGSVILGLLVFVGGGVHYGAMYVSWKRQRKFVDRYVRDARRAAWGDDSGVKGIPGIDDAMTGSGAMPTQQESFARENGAAVLNRRQKRMQEREDKKEAKKWKGKEKKGGGTSGSSTPLVEEPVVETPLGPQGTKKKVQAENGKVLIVDSVGNVFLEETDEEGERKESLLDPEELPMPSWRDTVLVRLPVWAFDSLKGRLFRRATEEEMEEVEVDDDGAEENGNAVVEKRTNGTTRKRGKRNVVAK